MSMIEHMMESCQKMVYERTDDQFGGYSREWTQGDTFDAAIIKNSTTEAMIAEKQGIKEIFTVVTAKGTGLKFHDVFVRLSDNQMFRVTSDQLDSEAPGMSSVQIGKVTAEKLELLP